MRRAFAILALLLALPATTAAECGKKDGNDPPPKVNRPVINAQVVQVCLDSMTRIRRLDSWCEPKTEGNDWFYPERSANWLDHPLPAIGERLPVGWGTQARPGNSEPVRIPPEGGVFAR